MDHVFERFDGPLSVGFRFTDGGVDESRLTQRIALHDPGTLSRIRRTLDWLPLGGIGGI